jgi:hypothetical protein
MRIQSNYEYEIKFLCPDFFGIVKPNDIIEVSEETYNKELKDDPRWSVVKPKKGDK